MKKIDKERLSPPALGGSSLLVVFAVLCLVVFALLSLSTVQAERRTSNAARDAAAAYYSADLEAERIFARLRSGEEIPGTLREDGTYSYGCTISENQMLIVELAKDESAWRILRWQSVARQGEVDETLPVWDGA